MMHHIPSSVDHEGEGHLSPLSPSLLRYRLLAMRVDMPLHPSNTHAMKDGPEALHLIGIARCASRGFTTAFGESARLL